MSGEEIDRRHNLHHRHSSTSLLWGSAWRYNNARISIYYHGCCVVDVSSFLEATGSEEKLCYACSFSHSFIHSFVRSFIHSFREAIERHIKERFQMSYIMSLYTSPVVFCVCVRVCMSEYVCVYVCVCACLYMCELVYVYVALLS